MERDLTTLREIVTAWRRAEYERRGASHGGGGGLPVA